MPYKSAAKRRAYSRVYYRGRPGGRHAYSREHYVVYGDRAKAAAALQVMRKYALSFEEYDALLKQPCGICGGASQAIDHDHLSGRVRGALCLRCNSGLGFFQDDPARLTAAREYLEKGRLGLDNRVW